MAVDPLWGIGVIIFVVVFFGLILISYISILIAVISQKASELAIYHAPRTQNDKDGEPFGLKLKRVMFTYAFLSLFVYVAIIVTLRFSGIENLDSNLLVAQVGTVAFLIIMRLLLNPTWTNSIVKLNKETEINEAKNRIRIFKERIHSLFFSYICITWIVFILYLFGTIGSNPSFNGAINYFLPSDLDGTLILILFVSYTISLIVLAFLSEIYLLRNIPIDQIPWSVKKINSI